VARAEVPRAWTRYLRQIDLLGPEGQERLADTTIAIVGLGGLGSVVSMYLAAAGVGRLRLVDHDIVEVHNLNRQLLYGEPDLGLPKAYQAARRLHELNPAVRVEPLRARLERRNAKDIVRGADIVVDALDNWEARLALADAAWELGIPLVHAAVEVFYGQLTTIEAGKTPCLWCIAPPPQARRNVSVLGPVVGLVASLEALEALKLATGLGDPLYGRLVVVDALAPSLDIVELKRVECDDCRRLRAGKN
jgi:molybdopterin/thiamine biosynthesis adenylyltransferase